MPSKLLTYTSTSMKSVPAAPSPARVCLLLTVSSKLNRPSSTFHARPPKAQEDQKKIREDYERQFERFRQAHGREPTTSELVQAHWNRYAGDLEQYFNEFDNDLNQFYEGSKSTGHEGDKEAAEHDEMEVEKVGDKFKEIFKMPTTVATVESDDDDDDFPFKPFTSPITKPAGSHSH